MSGTQVRKRSTKANGTNGTHNNTPSTNGHSHTQPDHDHNHDHDHANGDEHSHSHSHSLFGHSHSHSPGEGAVAQEGDKIIAALKGSGDRGSYITLVGLFSNVVLTTAKGAAGWYLHSASLLADAGHSMSDLLGDFVTLFCWKLSRKPPTERYPYGFAKFETLGTTVISILLVGGALGIGFHSYHLLMLALGESLHTIPPGVLHDILATLTTAPLPHIGHEHAHGVDPNAAWFAAISIVAKEWLYRITKVVADEERSPVLLANAIHHRSDAYSSAVAFFAILGTWLFPAFPLDPIGGLVVSIVILRQGWELLMGAWGDLTDASASPRTMKKIVKVLEPLVNQPMLQQNGYTIERPATLLGVEQLRARHAGSLLFVDLTAQVSRTATVTETNLLEQKIRKTLMDARREIKEVSISFKPQDRLDKQ